MRFLFEGFSGIQFMRDPQKLRMRTRWKSAHQLIRECSAKARGLNIDRSASSSAGLSCVALIAGACKSVGVSAVALSPFSRASRHSTGTVNAYRSALRDLAKVHNIILVDCVDALRALPEPLVLHHDGRKLSPMGQETIGRSLPTPGQNLLGL